MLRETARRFFEREWLPHQAERDAAGRTVTYVPALSLFLPRLFGYAG